MTQHPAAATVLAMSSQVVYGPVGNSAAVPAMQALGLSVLALPTVILSHHPGHGPPVRQVIAAEMLEAMLERVASHGWLDGISGVMTGYFADRAQVEVAAGALTKLRERNPDLVYLCDPIIGDDQPGLYVPDEVARAIASRLVPLADVIAPNRFELAWLSGAGVNDPRSVLVAARGLAPLCLATSVPLGDDRLATMLIGKFEAWQVETIRRAEVPHGTGDLLAGLFLAHLLRGQTGPEALALSLGAIEAVLDQSQCSDALDLARGLARPAARLEVLALEAGA